MVTVPEDAVLVELLCWVKPEVNLLLSPCLDTSIPINICLHYPLSSLLMTKQFNVDLIMVVRVKVCIRQLQNCTSVCKC